MKDGDHLWKSVLGVQAKAIHCTNYKKLYNDTLLDSPTPRSYFTSQEWIFLKIDTNYLKHRKIKLTPFPVLIVSQCPTTVELQIYFL